jgi:hypothetical protein
MQLVDDSVSVEYLDLIEQRHPIALLIFRFWWLVSKHLHGGIWTDGRMKRVPVLTLYPESIPEPHC